MGYASIAGRARTDPRAPQAHGICDRCGFRYNLVDLVWQHAWRGNDYINTRFRVCTVTCLDAPFQLNRPLILPPDPPPVDQPRVEAFAIDEAGPESWDGANEYWDGGLQWDAGGSGNTNLNQNSNLPTGPDYGEDEE